MAVGSNFPGRRWVENPYFQYFCGEEFFQHSLVSTARR